MSRLEEEPQGIELPQLIDQYFPFSTLSQWASEVKKHPCPIEYNSLMELVRQVTKSPEFKNTLLKEANLGERDFCVIQPSTGSRKEIHHGSVFYLDSLYVLEDPNLFQVVSSLLDSEKFSRRTIPRAPFARAINGAIIAVGALTVPHGLDKKGINTAVKQHCLRITVNNLGFNDELEAVLCFYGGMKIIANRLKYGL